MALMAMFMAKSVSGTYGRYGMGMYGMGMGMGYGMGYGMY